jgi:hypothetical protein
MCECGDGGGAARKQGLVYPSNVLLVVGTLVHLLCTLTSTPCHHQSVYRPSESPWGKYELQLPRHRSAKKKTTEGNEGVTGHGPMPYRCMRPKPDRCMRPKGERAKGRRGAAFPRGVGRGRGKG